MYLFRNKILKIILNTSIRWNIVLSGRRLNCTARSWKPATSKTKDLHLWDTTIRNGPNSNVTMSQWNRRKAIYLLIWFPPWLLPGLQAKKILLSSRRLFLLTSELSTFNGEVWLVLILYFVLILHNMFWVHNDKIIPLLYVMRNILVVLLLLKNNIKIKEQRKK